MDLKRVQEELKSDIVRHQALMQQLKKNPTDQALKIKLKAVQRHITELGSQQKRILTAAKHTQSLKNPEVVPLTTGSLSEQLQSKVNSSNASPSYTNQTSKVTSDGSNSTYTLITIKNMSTSVTSITTQRSPPPNNLPINLSRISASSSSSVEKPFVSPTLLVVSSPNQISVNKPTAKPVVSDKSAPVPMSLSSLVSTGGIVTLAGGWKGPPQPSISVNSNSTVVDATGTLMAAKQVQIKVPVVQTPSPVILMPQKSSANSQSKSLFRLLPKGRHPIPLNPNHAALVSGGSQTVISAPQTGIVKASTISQKQLPAIIMSSEPSINKNQPLHQVLVQRVGNIPSAPPATSVTWQDLSSRTPAIHKPSYVPRKTFPNMNNGVGSFQKFRILDGKAQILPKPSESSDVSSSFVQGAQEKPRNTALKAVLTSSKPVTSTPGMVTLARLVPAPIPKNGFFPIQQQDSAPVKPVTKPFRHSSSSDSPFVPVTVTAASSFRPVSADCNSNRPLKDSRSQTPIAVDAETKSKLSFLRNIDLIPKEQAEKVRGRRFRKRRVAANPVYSSGVYISNEFEPKRQCPDIMAGALESITAPDVIVKRPRGRPRGSKNISSPAPRLQPPIRRGRTASPSIPAHVEELRQLRGILDVVASASKAVTSAGTSVDTEVENLSASAVSSQGLCTSKLSQAVKIPDANSIVRSEKVQDDSADEHEDQCAICGKTGEVLMCDTCSRVYHLSCATPPLSSVPQGMWICSKCKKEFKDRKPVIEWPGIVAAVHSYVEHDEKRDADIENQRVKLDEAKNMVSALQGQTKTLTSVVKGKVAQRSKMMKEKQLLQKEILDLGNIAQSVWNSIARGESVGN